MCIYILLELVHANPLKIMLDHGEQNTLLINGIFFDVMDSLGTIHEGFYFNFIHCIQNFCTQYTSNCEVAINCVQPSHHQHYSPSDKTVLFVS